MSPSRLAAVTCAACLAASPALAAPRDAPIQDNSFLVEEAYNQEPGVIQHIGAFERERDRSWTFTFTEEWPVLGQTHQASVTLRYARLEEPDAGGPGDVALNYRWQAIGSGDTDLAIAPRLSVILPTGDAARGLGSGGTGLEASVPVSTVLSERLVAHTNGGVAWIPSARAADGGRGPLVTLTAGQSLVWLAHPSVNFLVEALYTRSELAGPRRSERDESLTLNPGVRAAIDFASGLQIVPGLSVPVGVGPSRGERAIFLYLSFEHPFRLAGPTEDEARAKGSGRDLR